VTTTLIITVVLTALAAVDVVLTRLRLGRSDGMATRLSIPAGLLNLHTTAGLLALVAWVGYLATHLAVLGPVAVALWWVAVVAGLLILARWLPARGRHSSGPVRDNWLDGGPGLSLLAHLGLLGGAVVFTTYWWMGWV
jgi:hypothetical protein